MVQFGIDDFFDSEVTAARFANMWNVAGLVAVPPNATMDQIAVATGL